jgi:hypothetical protein
MGEKSLWSTLDRFIVIGVLRRFLSLRPRDVGVQTLFDDFSDPSRICEFLGRLSRSAYVLLFLEAHSLAPYQRPGSMHLLRFYPLQSGCRMIAVRQSASEYVEFMTCGIRCTQCYRPTAPTAGDSIVKRPPCGLDFDMFLTEIQIERLKRMAVFAAARIAMLPENQFLSMYTGDLTIRTYQNGKSMQDATLMDFKVVRRDGRLCPSVADVEIEESI